MTGIIVTYNTRDVFAECVAALRLHCPELPLVIIDGSAPNNSCYTYVRSLQDENTKVFQLGYNIGHGLGLHAGIQVTTDEQLLLIDSDAIVLRSPLAAMAEQLTEGVYAVGEQYFIGRDGLHRNPVRDLPYIRPYFMLLSRTMYYRWPRFIHHGSPCIKAMLKINQEGRSAQLLRPFDLTSYVRHDWGATRKYNASHGQPEIPNAWER